MEDYDIPESKFGRIFKVAGPCKPLILTLVTLTYLLSDGINFAITLNACN